MKNGRASRRFDSAGRLIPRIFAALIFISNIGLAQKPGDAISIGTYDQLHSKIMNEDRLLLVHLPRDYADTQLSYPVLYVLYGQDVNNYFADAVIVSEKLGGTGEIPPLIIVGVVNTNRYRDNLPAPTMNGRDGGGADRFLTFFEEELIPYVGQKYRTKNFRILAGPQAGAVFGLFALITKPALFNAVLSENPFMNPENSAVLYPKVEAFFRNTPQLKGFLYVQGEKTERKDNLEYADRFFRLLESAKPRDFRFRLEIKEPSGYFIPPLPFRDGLRALFEGHALPADFKASGVDDVIAYYRKLSETYGLTVDAPEMMLTFEVDKLTRQRKWAAAIAMCEYQLSLYPKSLNALLRLAEICRNLGEFERAREYYRSFLSIRTTDAAFVQNSLGDVERMINGSAAYRVEQATRKEGAKAGWKTLREIRADPKTSLYFSESELNAAGYRFLGSGKIDDAVEIFKMNVQLNPRSANAYDSLGEAYMTKGDKTRAIQNYKKSLELNPKNANAAAMLKKLGTK